ncbi:MAG: sel1 repeat family protein [Selenomonadaceae bacterium]|nr:sel1 repeat family protein [Selenomonadaceae bacterium]
MNSKKDALKFYEIGCRAKNLFLYDVAIKYLTKAAECGNADAMYLLGNIYKNANWDYELQKEDERIVINDDEQFFKWYKRAADKGCKEAFIEVALYYLEEDNLEYNKRAANKWLKLAISWNQSAAEKGDPVAMLAVAEAYSRYNSRKTLNYGGLFGKEPLSDKWRKLAFAIFKRLADEGDAEAMTNLGIMFYYGEGVTENYAESVRFLKRAAESDDDEIKIRDSISFYKKAAQLRDFISMRILWNRYKTGKGVEKNLAEAERWLNKSQEIQTEFLTVLKREEN